MDKGISGSILTKHMKGVMNVQQYFMYGFGRYPIMSVMFL